MHRYTEEQKMFIIDNNYGNYSFELAELFNKHFNTNITSNEIKYFRRNHRLNSGLTGRFEKGHIPSNKGKKWDDFMSKDAQANSRKTTFKKGNISHNAVPIGTEKIKYSKNDDIGYLYVKVQEGKLHKNWKPKQVLVYEQHYGKVPRGYKVIFADGNRFNFDIDNLILVSDSEELILNRYGLRFNDKNLTESSVLIAKVIDKANKLKNERL